MINDAPSPPSGHRQAVSLRELAASRRNARLGLRRSAGTGSMGSAGLIGGKTAMLDDLYDWWSIESEVGLGEYTVHPQIWSADDDEFIDRFEETDLPAWEVDLTEGIEVNRIVAGRLIDLNDGTLAVLFTWRNWTTAVGMFACTVTKVGGDSGDAATLCDYVYRVDDLEGNQIAPLSLAPQKWRNPGAKRAMLFPEAGSVGSAYYDENGDIQLFDANEVPAVTVCP